MRRRDLLFSAAALASVPQAARAAPRAFPPGFRWGAATSAYQVEGAVAADGRGRSIWDGFVRRPGAVRGGDTGDVACDSYRRWRDDLALLRDLGLTSYRFSIAWPRIQPGGRGPANQTGLDHYRRLADALLAAGIRPFPTLYHWDLPQALEDAGGWPVRDTALRLADYAAIVARALGDRVGAWTVLNEPKTFTQLGYWTGIHAPGRRDPAAFLRASHHANLAQGLAARAIRAERPHGEVGNAWDVAPCFPASPSADDAAATARFDRFNNLWFAQPLFTGTYPDLLPADRRADLLGWQDDDDRLLKAPPDFVGLNYYSGFRVTADPAATDIPGLAAHGEWARSPHATGRAANGWDIDADGFHDILVRMAQVTGATPIEITENGTADNTRGSGGAAAGDTARGDYLRDHLGALHRAIADGVPVRGYHAWSLLDNFEWAESFSQRFGLVEVDFDGGQARRIKASGHAYAAIARRNALA